MTRRERMKDRAERRREWAASREAKSAVASNGARSLLDGIPLGQPILVGHHSEKRHRRTIDRAHNLMGKAVECDKMAAHHESKAAGIEAQLASSIFSDDENAAEALEAKAAELDAAADRCKSINAAFRKAPGNDKADRLIWCVRSGLMTQEEASKAAHLFVLCPYEKQPFPAYHLTSLRANARRARERIKDVRARQERQTRAEAAGGLEVRRGAPHPCWSCRGSKVMGDDDPRPCYICAGSGTSGPAQAQVTFADYPGRRIVDALKGAGFHWSGGSWFGDADKLPACVAELEGGQDA